MAPRMDRWRTPENLVDRLKGWAAHDPGRTAIRFVGSGDVQPEELTYGELHERARAVAADIDRRHGRGNRVLVALQRGPEFAAAFLGCLYAGAIAVPVHVPRRNRHLERFAGILRSSGARFGFAAAELRADLRNCADPGAWAGITWLELGGEPPQGDGGSAPFIHAGKPAFLQYTSGSTAEPRGVVVTHGNIEHNVGLLGAYSAAPRDETTVSWLPLFHDMGLVTGLLAPIYHGATTVLMLPATFLTDPLGWLRAIGRFGGTFAAAPNFALDLCTARLAGAPPSDIDLSRLRNLLVGAEPIQAGTLERFASAFGPAGFRTEAFRPGYGLAEATLIVTGTPEPRPLLTCLRGRAQPRAGGAVAGPNPAGATRLVSSGRPVEGLRVRIADPETRRGRGNGEVGEIWVSGASVAGGYWGDPDLTREAFGARLPGEEGRFLRTGDLGFLQDGELYVTGRLKDLIIIGGVNHYPQDIELTALGAHPALSGAGGAAFAIVSDRGEELAVLHELNLAHRDADPDEVFGALRRAVSEQHQLAVVHFALVRFASLPRTTSGKIQRGRARDLFLEGALDASYTTRATRSALSPGAPPEGPALEPEAFGRLRAAVARILEVAPESLDPARPLVQQGLSSLRAAELQVVLESEFACKLLAEDFFEPWTLGGLALRVAGTGAPPTAPERSVSS